MPQYGPFVGCTDGQAAAVHRVMDECADVGLNVLLDVHAMRDSQNGFDNSGRARDIVCVGRASQTQPSG